MLENVRKYIHCRNKDEFNNSGSYGKDNSLIIIFQSIIIEENTRKSFLLFLKKKL